MIRRRRSTGTIFAPSSMVAVYRAKSRERRQAADIAAVDRGEIVTAFCYCRGLYGRYPRQFTVCMLDLAPGGLVIRPAFPLFLLASLWRRIPVTERVVSARVRAFASECEAAQHLNAGLYSSGAPLGQQGFEIVSCETSGGTFEFSMRRADVPLLLHYLGRLAEQGAQHGG